MKVHVYIDATHGEAGASFETVCNMVFERVIGLIRDGQ